MKLILILLAVMLSQLTLAETTGNSELMVKTMEDAGVTAWGRKKNLQASVVCKVNRFQVFRCTISATGDFDNLGGVHKFYTGDEAITISNLLKTFDVLPVGRRLVQEASILCRVEKRESVQTCSDISFDYPTN
jgi:hypothetical protein